jgi:Ca2+-binding RTX toxin-like protein
MRRVTLVLAAMAMMVSLFAVVAYAAEIQGTNNSEELNESNKNDEIHALVGDDKIFAGVYQNIGDTDRVHGNKGDDFIYVKDQDNQDTAWGGKGSDTCQGDLGDTFISCETIVP